MQLKCITIKNQPYFEITCPLCGYNAKVYNGVCIGGVYECTNCKEQFRLYEKHINNFK